ncbi:MAG: hypothetical protein QHC67_14610 [Sphingobium sp.]|uniref:hypothetical protein n=1 Tax=Sphingobium sp. TaxID=1912891 RepID=UPI0029BBEDD2|nr:hypothetical protein [Sphingobium sp.]MDX3911033.1 hypothetical protein [Sphingobium sp.]
MSNSYVKAAFSLFMSAEDAAMVAKALRASELLTDNLSDPDLKLSFDALGHDFITLFPAKGPNHFGSFIRLFDDPAYPTFDCEIAIGEPDSCDVCEVTFSGNQFGIESVARLIHTACRAALPCGFEWAYTGDKLRCGEHGGGYVVITGDGPAFRTTSTLLREALVGSPAPAEPVIAVFDPALVTIEPRRFSVTQSEVLVSYNGQRIEQYGDSIRLVEREWQGHTDAFWMAVAYREATLRGLATRLPVAEEAAFMAPLARS